MAFVAAGTLPGLTYEVAVNFSGSTWTDVSSSVESFGTSITKTRGASIWGPGRGTVLLANNDNAFTSSNTSSAYYGNLIPGKAVRVKAQYASVTYDVMTYLADDWIDDPIFVRSGVSGGRSVCRVPGQQPTTLLSDWKASPGTAAEGAGETTSARVSRILTAAGWTRGSFYSGSVPLQAIDWTKDAWSHLVDAARAEGGFLWCLPSGDIVAANRHRLLDSASLTSACTLGTGAGEVPFLADPAPQLSSGVDLARTRVIRGNVGQSAHIAEDTSGLGGRVIVDSDVSQIGESSIIGRANAEQVLALRKTPVQHPTSVTILPASSPAVAWPQVLGRGLLDRITVKVPRANGTTHTVDCWITGISHSVSPRTGWRTTWDLEPAVFTSGEYGVWGSGVWGTFKWAW